MAFGVVGFGVASTLLGVQPLSVLDFRVGLRGFGVEFGLGIACLSVWLSFVRSLFLYLINPALPVTLLS